MWHIVRNRLGTLLVVHDKGKDKEDEVLFSHSNLSFVRDELGSRFVRGWTTSQSFDHIEKVNALIDELDGEPDEVAYQRNQERIDLDARVAEIMHPPTPKS